MAAIRRSEYGAMATEGLTTIAVVGPAFTDVDGLFADEGAVFGVGLRGATTSGERFGVGLRGATASGPAILGVGGAGVSENFNGKSEIMLWLSESFATI